MRTCPNCEQNVIRMTEITHNIFQDEAIACPSCGAFLTLRRGSIGLSSAAGATMALPVMVAAASLGIWLSSFVVFLISLTVLAFVPIVGVQYMRKLELEDRT